MLTSPDYTLGSGTRYSRAGGGIFRISLGSSQKDYSVEKIIKGQVSDEVGSEKSDYILKNDEKELLLPRVIKILDKIKEEA